MDTGFRMAEGLDLHRQCAEFQAAVVEEAQTWVPEARRGFVAGLRARQARRQLVRYDEG